MSLRWPGSLVVGSCLIATIVLTACGAPDKVTEADTAAATETRTGPAPDPWFRERAEKLGLDFHHFNGATPETFMAEIMGSGCALFDYDGDGDLDAYLVQGGRINEKTPLKFPATATGVNGSLFENRLVPDGALFFTDVSAGSGLQNRDTGMGVATGDLDNDGDLDLYLSNLGHDALFINNGDGTFLDRSDQLTDAVSGWSTSVAFLDYNRDGNLDIVVARYVDMDRTIPKQCSSLGIRDYCSPDVYRPMPDTLLRGDGRGNLSVVSDWQATAVSATGLGVTTGDYDGDGLIDIYVANDKRANQLWRNLGDGRFEDIALLAGTAFNGNGEEEAGMGVTTGDMDTDGDDDIFVTHLRGESNTLYVNNGSGLFFDGTLAAGLAAPSIPATAFGTRWFDVDLDGDLDLFAANGPVFAVPAQVEVEPFPYVQRNQLFENLGNGKFADSSDIAGFGSEKPEISRGAAFGDIDNDGDVDILVSNNHGPARLLINEAPRRGNWLSVRLVDTRGNRDGIGARIGVTLDDGKIRWRQVTTGDSYLSANDVRVHFGLGAMAKDTITVIVEWPGGKRDTWKDIKVNAAVTLTRGRSQQ